MKQDRWEEGRFSNQAHGLGTVTEEMIRQRAGELAVINGRSERQVMDSDLEQARKELLETQDPDPEPTADESIEEENRWDAVADNSGKQTPNFPAPDEQTFAEKLVQEGVEDAEHDQMLRATRDMNKRDKE